MPVVCCIGRYIEKIRTLIIGCYSSRNPYYWHFSNYHYIHTRSMLDICKFHKGSSPEEIIELFEHYSRQPSINTILSICLLFLARSCNVLHLIEQDNNFDAMHACLLTIIPSYQKLFFTHSSVNSIHLIIFSNKTTNSAFSPKYDDDNKPTGPWWKCCLCDTLECIESRKPISRCQNMLHNFCRA